MGMILHEKRAPKLERKYFSTQLFHLQLKTLVKSKIRNSFLNIGVNIACMKVYL